MDRLFYWGMIVAAFIAAIRQNVDAMQLVLIVAILIRLDMPKEDK